MVIQMSYAIKAHPTKYNGVQFRSRLEARWACFFDLAKWNWQYEPIDLTSWCPDFWVEFPCQHSECSGSHVLLVEVKPYYSIAEFNEHPCMKYAYGEYMEENGVIDLIPADASAAFGIDPSVTYWEMAHGAGGGIESVENWVCGDADAMWKQAGNSVQWKPRLV
jgi:hypothetical protein